MMTDRTTTGGSCLGRIALALCLLAAVLLAFQADSDDLGTMFLLSGGCVGVASMALSLGMAAMVRHLRRGLILRSRGFLYGSAAVGLSGLLILSSFAVHGLLILVLQKPY
jgi:hypothetical protein